MFSQHSYHSSSTAEQNSISCSALRPQGFRANPPRPCRRCFIESKAFLRASCSQNPKTRKGSIRQSARVPKVRRVYLLCVTCSFSSHDARISIHATYASDTVGRLPANLVSEFVGSRMTITACRTRAPPRPPPCSACRPASPCVGLPRSTDGAHHLVVQAANASDPMGELKQVKNGKTRPMTIARGLGIKVHTAACDARAFKAHRIY